MPPDSLVCRNILMDTAVLLNQKRANVCEYKTKTALLEFLKGATRGLREEWLEGNLKGDYLRLMSGLCLEDRMLVHCDLFNFW